MLNKLGGFIEKKPLVVIVIIVIVTLGFSSFLPQIEFKTDFNEFMPDDELSRANNRVQDYFGTNNMLMFILAEKNQSSSVITPESVKELYYIEENLNKHEDISAIISLSTFLNSVCFVEFGKSIDNCSNEEIEIVLEDFFMEQKDEEIKLFQKDDPNEDIDFYTYPKLSKGKSIDSADIKNCYISKSNDSITFSIEVYDLSNFESSLMPSFSKVNNMEWFIDFENLIKPDEMLDISYRISAHVEPGHPIWEIGKGILPNIRNLFSYLKNRELFNSYKTEAYLWIRPPGESMYFPMPLESGNITIEKNSNRIEIDVSREEIGQYGIATQIGSFELPAKLSNFKAGVRYYQTSIFKRIGGRLSMNTSFLFDRVEQIKNRPLIGSIAEKFLQRYGDISWEDFDNIFETISQTEELPETVALRDIDSLWTTADELPDSSFSETKFFILPHLYEELQVNSVAFLSDDYNQTKKPKASLIILQLDVFDENYDEMTRINNEIVEMISSLDKKYNYISTEVTGELVVSSQIEELTTDANMILGPAMFLMIVIVLFFSFRKTSYVILPMLSLLVSTIWLFGTMVLFGIAFNVIAVALIPLILGLGVDYAVHLFHNYKSELEKGLSPGKAIKNSVKEIGTAMFLAWLTTIIAFMSFLTSNILPIRQFGILLAFGITYTFITAITLLASLRYFTDKKKPPKINNKKQTIFNRFSLKNIMGKMSALVLCHQKKIISTMLIITFIFALGAIQLERGFDMDQFVPEENPAMELFDKIAEYFPYASEYQEYILIEGNIASVEVLEGIKETHEKVKDDTFIAKNTDGSVKISSIYSVIIQSIKNNRSLIDKFNINEQTYIPRTDSDVRALFDYLYDGNKINLDGFNVTDFDLEEFGSSEVKMVLHKNNSKYDATIVRYYVDTTFGANGGNIQSDLETLEKEIQGDLSNYGDSSHIATGLYAIQLNNTKSLTSSQITSTGVSIILAALVLIITYRNPSLGLITMIPVGFSIIWILGTMYYLGYILDIMTVTVTSITIGIGIDYAIHATHRFRIVAETTGDIDKAVCETISHTGGALLIAALTTALAFGILILAPIPPQQRFGIILAITITYSFITSVLLLPLILARWAKWRKKRKGYIVSPGPPKDNVL